MKMKSQITRGQHVRQTEFVMSTKSSKASEMSRSKLEEDQPKHTIDYSQLQVRNLFQLMQSPEGKFDRIVEQSPDIFVLFVDPESLLHYRVYLNKPGFLRIEPIPDEFPQKSMIKERNKQVQYKIQKLLIQENFLWNFHEADFYRRRTFPTEFLTNEASPYPCYVFQSPLSKAFDQDFQIEAEIDLTEFKGDNIPQLISLKESLVTSTNEFIKNIQKKVIVKDKTGVRCALQPRPGHNLILQTAGCREYFVGNYQLLQYERVRLCLRKKTKMKLILTQIPQSYASKFPPLYRPKPNADKTQKQASHSSMVESSHDMKDDHLYAADMTQIFQDCVDSSPYFWYSPVPNLKVHEKQINQQQQSSTPKGGQEASQTSRNVVQISKEKHRISLTQQRYLTGGTTIPKENETIVLHSGESSFQFKFKLQQLERINVLFNEIQEQVATKYDSTMPKNVTFREDAVVDMKQKTTAIADLKNFFSLKFKSGKEKKENDGMHPIIKKAASLADDKDQLVRLQMPIIEVKPQKGQQLLSQLLDAQAKIPRAKTTVKETTEFKKDKALEKSKHGHGKGKVKDTSKLQAYEAQKKQFLKDNIDRISTSFVSFGDNIGPIRAYENLLEYQFGKLTPIKLRVECTLYHGCDKIGETQCSNDVSFNSNVVFNELITFDKLKYCQIPVKTRLSFEIVLIFKENSKMTIGCVSMNLFNEKGIFNSGVRDLNVWPFYAIDERLGCMKEYDGLNRELLNDKDLAKKIHLLFTKLVVRFESFICPMMYSSRDGKKIEKLKLTQTEEDQDDEQMLMEESHSNENLAKLKTYFDLECTPLEVFDDKKKRQLFKCREHYQTHPRGLPIFLKSVKWDRPVQVNVVYNMLENWAPMSPEDAIQLLDAKFPDERVRKYAVKRISLLSDDELALYMLQFSQALLYEEQHWSPLSEMLIQRSLQNPYVVGQAFFWGLRSNLYLKASYVRYYVLLEQFLMLCGTYINEIWIQFQVNRGLQKVSENVTQNRLSLPHAEVEDRAKKDLREARKNLPLLFTTVCDSKFILKDFAYEKLKIFSSAKAPLLIRAVNNIPGKDLYQTIFKNGDDLRQDILTLQILAIMDRMWLENQLDLAMTAYKVLGTDLEQGFLEFNANCTTLADIQVIGGIKTTFSETTIDQFFRDKIRQDLEKQNLTESQFDQKLSEKLEKIRDVFIRSTAGYCVASYVLGLGDRHADNIMINEKEGNFLHIDFGHFLQNYKYFRIKKIPALPGIPREVDPFVFTPEIAYFVNGQSFKKKPADADKSDKKSGKLHKGEEDEEMKIISRDADLDKLQAAAGSVDEGVAEELKTKNFKKFEQHCCRAYEILRLNADQLVTLFQIMLSAGMPELNHDNNIKKMTERLHLEMTEREASKHFKMQIQAAMTTLMRRIDNLMHNVKHKKPQPKPKETKEPNKK